jgi:polyphosphate kinase 2 (PPK2 family)
MLDKVDLNRKVGKADFKQQIEPLQARLGQLQRQAQKLKIPINVVFEGWGASGKGSMINRVLLALDPRGFTVHPILPPTQEELYRPFLWRFWTKLPERGRMAIFDRSWYRRVLNERVNRDVPKKVWERAYDQINAFERQLVDDDAIIVKFFLHISAKEQEKRFKRLERDPATSWRVTKEDWKNHKHYSRFVSALENVFARTDTEYARWQVVPAQNWRYATLKVFQTLVATIESGVIRTQAAVPGPPAEVSAQAISTGLVSNLDKADLSRVLDREEYEEQLKTYQAKIRRLEYIVYRERIPVVVAYEGWDAAGKGGNIRRLVQNMDPRGYRVIPIAAPNDYEKAHHYLWRFWEAFPKAGHIGIFDRTWYGRVLVERVEGFCSREDCERSFREINEMEEVWTAYGTVMIKFWLQISKEEQLRRFQAREANPLKQWKITEEDWRNREKWDKYKIAVDEMLYRTSTTYAPWTVVESNDKLYARIKALKTVCTEIERRL